MSELEDQLKHQVRKLELNLEELAARDNIKKDTIDHLATLLTMQGGVLRDVLKELERRRAEQPR